MMRPLLLTTLISFVLLTASSALAQATGSGTDAAQRQACERVGELKVSLGQVMAERDEARAQFAAAEEEVADLKAARDRLTAEREETKAQLAAAQQEIGALTKRLEDPQPKPRKRGASAP